MRYPGERVTLSALNSDAPVSLHWLTTEEFTTFTIARLGGLDVCCRETVYDATAGYSIEAATEPTRIWKPHQLGMELHAAFKLALYRRDSTFHEVSPGQHREASGT